MILDNVHDDVNFFWKDPKKYLKMSDEMYSRYEDALKEHMGDEFSLPPLPLREELEKEIESRITRLKHLSELRAPPVFRDSEQRILEEALTALNQGEYAVTKEEFNYIESYYARLNSFTKKPNDFVILE